MAPVRQQVADLACGPLGTCASGYMQAERTHTEAVPTVSYNSLRMVG